MYAESNNYFIICTCTLKSRGVSFSPACKDTFLLVVVVVDVIDVVVVDDVIDDVVDVVDVVVVDDVIDDVVVVECYGCSCC